jgi:hypothetical protein
VGLEREQDRVRVGGSPVHCPFCKGELADTKAIVACAACGARHHESCHNENGRCASCGSTDKLVPAAPRPAPVSVPRQRREQPLAGGKIQVAREGEDLVYSWERRTPADLALAILMTIVTVGLFAPFAFYLLYHYFKRTRSFIRVKPDRIEFSASGFRERTVTARREDLGRIQLLPIGAQGQLGMGVGIDIGAQRHLVKFGSLMQNTTIQAPELEWLVQALQAWKEEGA